MPESNAPCRPLAYHKLKAIMSQRQLTYSYLAELLHQDIKTVSLKMNGERLFRIDECTTILDNIEMDYQDVFGTD